MDEVGELVVRASRDRPEPAARQALARSCRLGSRSARDARSIAQPAVILRAVELHGEDDEVLPRHVDGHVVDGNGPDGSGRRAVVRVAVHDELGPVHPDRAGEAVWKTPWATLNEK